MPLLLDWMRRYQAERPGRFDMVFMGHGEVELPKAPWHEPGTSWSVRRVVLHIIAETAQHAGHADILREHIDGATSM